MVIKEFEGFTVTNLKAASFPVNISPGLIKPAGSLIGSVPS